jgi:hypothetical protein
MILVSDGCVGDLCGSPDLALPALPFFPYMVKVLEIKEQAYKYMIETSCS